MRDFRARFLPGRRLGEDEDNGGIGPASGQGLPKQGIGKFSSSGQNQGPRITCAGQQEEEAEKLEGHAHLDSP